MVFAATSPVAEHIGPLVEMFAARRLDDRVGRVLRTARVSPRVATFSSGAVAISSGRGGAVSLGARAKPHVTLRAGRE